MRRLALAVAAAGLLAPGLACAQDTQTVITQASPAVTGAQSNAIAQAAAGTLSGLRGNNVSVIVQNGASNRGSTDQTGYGNSAMLTQSGSGNSAALVQNSDYGSINATQTGNGIGITITQTGHAPAITITQTRPGR